VLGCPVGAGAQDLAVSGNLTAVGQATTDDSIRDEVVSSFDLFVDLQLGPGQVHTYFEVNTTPFSGGVSSLLPGANADAGTALDRRGRGRVQVSELRLAWPLWSDFRAHVGLLDATGFIDVSRIANDENLFFLGVPFVNNPTIGFPDYTLGFALEGEFPFAAPLTVGAVLTRSRGLADDECSCYGRLFDLDVQAQGAFIGSAIRWESGAERISLGAWLDTSERVRLDGSGRVGTARGVFAVFGHRLGEHSLSVRAGLANGEVLANRGFLGLSYVLARSFNAVGVAVGRTIASKELPGLEDADRGELFLRRRLVGDVFVTVSVQRMENGGAPVPSSVPAPGLWVGGLRLSAQF
jgi:hypothetical protein